MTLEQLISGINKTLLLFKKNSLCTELFLKEADKNIINILFFFRINILLINKEDEIFGNNIIYKILFEEKDISYRELGFVLKSIRKTLLILRGNGIRDLDNIGQIEQSI